MVAASALRRHATVEASGHGVTIGALGLGKRFVTSEAALQHIFSREPEHVGIVFEFPQGDVAVVAKQPSQFSRCMAVVKRQPLSSIVASADITMSMASEEKRLLELQPVLAHRLLNIATKRVAPISAAIALAGPVYVLNSVLPLTAGAAHLALRFPALLGYIVHAKIADRVNMPAFATRLLFHLCSIAKTRESVEQRALA